ncbi:XRE family transcriptional regulator [Halobacillus fulvus]|nr:XRE family transcriptional regulator [Halobacillus fulvus]
MNETKVDLKKIKLERKKLGISLEQMATKLGYESPNGYFYLESGKSKFTAEKLAIVGQILKIPINELFFTHEVTKMETLDSEEVI